MPEQLREVYYTRFSSYRLQVYLILTVALSEAFAQLYAPTVVGGKFQPQR